MLRSALPPPITPSPLGTRVPAAPLTARDDADEDSSSDCSSPLGEHTLGGSDEVRRAAEFGTDQDAGGGAPIDQSGMQCALPS